MNIYQEAVKKWGREAQMNMLIEECGELIVAIQKFKRGRGAINLLEECADVQIMLNQIPYMFPDCVGYLKNQQKYKIKRLRRKIRGKEE
jgi:NTP pyrophosphatase (non-canonical NTP hydrolase)